MQLYAKIRNRAQEFGLATSVPAWPHRLRDLADEVRPQLIDFCRRLIQTPSETGTEERVAAVYRAELERLEFDSITVDEFGNVTGRIPGIVDGRNVLFCGHLDQVGVEAHFPGKEGEWPYDPFEARIADGCIWGRGASDVKGSLAAQVYAAHVLKRLGQHCSGDLIVSGVAHDEPAFPAGIKYLFEHTLRHLGWDVHAAIVGPATGLDIALGHMGKVELDVWINGISRHISRQAEAINPILEARTLLDQLARLETELPCSTELGQEIMAPTIMRSTSKHSAHIPGACSVTINWRFLPGRSKDDLLRQLEAVCAEAARSNPRFRFLVKERTLDVRSYTGLVMTVPASCAAFLMTREHPYVKGAMEALHAVQQAPRVTTWPVPTHAGYVGGTLGIPTIGYSPCEYAYNHTPEDRVAIQALVDAIIGYAAIAHGVAPQ